MPYRLISLLPLQIARILGLVRAIEPAQLEGERAPSWVLLVRGRGFTRILRDEPLASPNLIRPSSWSLPRPIRFPSQQLAATYAQSVGLLPRRTTWSIKESDNAAK